VSEAVVTAPGKVLWAGEYAVLEGAPAVVTAVDRRVIARVKESHQPPSPFLRAVADELRREHGETLARRLSRIDVDSSRLQQDGKKLGLGSSAAVTVAATAAALAPIRPTRAMVHRLAHRAHALAQEHKGARGSGADVAASVHGGALVVQRTLDDLSPLNVRPLPVPAALHFALVWTGVPADTATLVAQVAKTPAPGPLQALGEVAVALAAAFEAGDAAAIVTLVADGAAALAALGAATAAPLVPPIWQTVHDVARAHRGAAKPTGAGGGDLLLAVFPDAGAVTGFRLEIAARGMMPVTCAVSPSGVDLQPPRETSKFPEVP
jgi:phosphomevalonate kinase